MTRLLKIPIIGRFTAAVDSSRIDMLAGLSKWPILKVPPDCWAAAPWARDNATSNGPAVAKPPRRRFISVYLPGFMAAPLNGVAAFAADGDAAVSGSASRLEFG